MTGLLIGLGVSGYLLSGVAACGFFDVADEALVVAVPLWPVIAAHQIGVWLRRRVGR